MFGSTTSFMVDLRQIAVDSFFKHLKIKYLRINHQFTCTIILFDNTCRSSSLNA